MYLFRKYRIQSEAGYKTREWQQKWYIHAGSNGLSKLSIPTRYQDQTESDRTEVFCFA